MKAFGAFPIDVVVWAVALEPQHFFSEACLTLGEALIPPLRVASLEAPGPVLKVALVDEDDRGAHPQFSRARSRVVPIHLSFFSRSFSLATWRRFFHVNPSLLRSSPTWFQ